MTRLELEMSTSDKAKTQSRSRWRPANRGIELKESDALRHYRIGQFT